MAGKPGDAEEALEWCDLALVTGTTVVNGTLEAILEVAGTKAVFYGISIAGLHGCWVSSSSVQGRREGADIRIHYL